MALVNLVGQGLWLPTIYSGFMSSGLLGSTDSPILTADQHEFQFIGQIVIDGGGSKTFGTSGSKISWLPGASITFAVNSTLTVGVKKAASVDSANGPSARATIGKAAFDVYKDLVGGTDTITSTTWRNDSMASGTPYTVTDGDLIAICVLLTTTAGTPSIKIRCAASITAGFDFPVATLVTAGPTYTGQATALPNFILTFDDGTIGWLAGTLPFSAVDVATSNIGNGNTFGNIFQVPFPCKVDAIAASVATAGGGDFALELYSTPLGTPAVIESSAVDQNITRTSSLNLYLKRLLTPRALLANTDYAVGIKQTTATNLTTVQRDQNATNYFKPLGMGAECYAATSTGGATFASVNSGKRRYHIWVRVSALDDGINASGGILRNPGINGGLIG